jgi:hypothetical protein
MPSRLLQHGPGIYGRSPGLDDGRLCTKVRISYTLYQYQHCISGVQPTHRFSDQTFNLQETQDQGGRKSLKSYWK